MSSYSAAPFGSPSKDTLAMSFFELDAPRNPNSDGFFSKVVSWPTRAVRGIQYGRMMQAMTSLSDSQLQDLGLTRSDIPRYARECIEEKHV